MKKMIIHENNVMMLSATTTESTHVKDIKATKKKNVFMFSKLNKQTNKLQQQQNQQKSELFMLNRCHNIYSSPRKH